MYPLRLVGSTVLSLFMSCGGLAEDWPEWRGAGRTAKWVETGVLKKFPEGGPTVRWRAELGSGYSAPVVADGRVVTMDFVPVEGSPTGEVLERVVCLDEKTGKQLWVDEVKTHYREVMQSYRTGPRAAPTISGGRVYTLGSVGHIRCLDLKSGQVYWSKDSRVEYGLTPPIWGTSTAPIVEGEFVIYATGGTQGEQVRAFDRLTGQEVWKSCPADYELGYSQFIVFDQAGVRQLIYWDPQYLRSLNPKTGEVYWQVPMNCKSAMSIATPVKSGNRLLVSSFYNGSMLVEMDPEKPTAKKLWHVQGKGERPNQTQGLHCVITTPVVQGDYFYGTGSYGEFRGLKLEDSSRVWENSDYTRQGRWGSCFFVQHEDRYFLFNDAGELLIVRLQPDGPELIDRTKLINPDTESGWGPKRWENSIVCWCHPAFANRHVIVRNDHEIMSVSLAADEYEATEHP